MSNVIAKVSLKKNTPIVFFDGVCGLCNHAVDIMIKIDSSKKLKYAPLQGLTASTLLPASFTTSLSTFVFLRSNLVYTKSDAVFEIVREMGGFWYIFLVFRIFPLSIRNGVYDFVAKNRLSWFGTRDSCRIPTVAERELFLE